MSPASPQAPNDPCVDAVVIGRNEGARLRDCLTSLGSQVRRVVYVDSGSTDGSVQVAAELGADVVALDMVMPFTAARARNAGLARLAGQQDPAEFIQMIDGDCALRDGWVATARGFLLAQPQAALVFGRRRERYPEASVYNGLCDWEWDTPPGPARSCGGDLLIRRAAVAQVGGYRDAVIAAEDDEICQRLLAKGWTLWRIGAEMTWHDAAISRFGQWWRRAVRAGHGFAQVGSLHPGHFVAARRRAWFWGAALPVMGLIGLLAAPLLAWVVAALLALSFARSVWRFSSGGMAGQRALACAGLITLSKLPNLQGVITYLWRHHQGASARIIEYK